MLRDLNKWDILIMKEYTILLMVLTRVLRFALEGSYLDLPCTLVNHPRESNNTTYSLFLVSSCLIYILHFILLLLCDSYEISSITLFNFFINFDHYCYLRKYVQLQELSLGRSWVMVLDFFIWGESYSIKILLELLLLFT